MNKRVLVAMSGGVDSSVTALLLLQQGVQVEGVTMKTAEGAWCDIEPAAAVCVRLGMPHRTVQVQEEFSRLVVQDFISEYCLGRTPNPCIRCNEFLKFGLLLEYARIQGFDFLATGHYARIEGEPAASRLTLKRGLDETKDQAYFLYRLTQEHLKHILLPLGGMKKNEVRRIAREARLPVAARPESQEVCFIPDNDYRRFIRERAAEALQPGKLVLTDGTVIGSHEGIAFFTVGQRRHLGVAAGERLYVVGIDARTNRVILGRSRELQTSEISVSNAVFSNPPETSSCRVQVKIRHRSSLAAAVIHIQEHAQVRVIFDHPVQGACPGQAAVFYNDDSIIGGGTIVRGGQGRF